MASKFFKDRNVLATASQDEQTGRWTIRIEVTRVFEPPDEFSTKEEAEDFGIQFAEHWIKARP